MDCRRKTARIPENCGSDLSPAIGPVRKLGHRRFSGQFGMTIVSGPGGSQPGHLRGRTALQRWPGFDEKPGFPGVRGRPLHPGARGAPAGSNSRCIRSPRAVLIVTAAPDAAVGWAMPSRHPACPARPPVRTVLLARSSSNTYPFLLFKGIFYYLFIYFFDGKSLNAVAFTEPGMSGRLRRRSLDRPY